MYPFTAYLLKNTISVNLPILAVTSVPKSGPVYIAIPVQQNLDLCNNHTNTPKSGPLYEEHSLNTEKSSLTFEQFGLFSQFFHQYKPAKVHSTLADLY